MVVWLPSLWWIDFPLHRPSFPPHPARIQAVPDERGNCRLCQADTMIIIRSSRLQLSRFQMADAEEAFACITPAIAKFMPWEPPSWSEYLTRCEKRVQSPEAGNFSFVIRRLDTGECLGMASFEGADSVSPE